MNIIKLHNFPMYFAALKYGSNTYYISEADYKILISNGFEIRNSLTISGVKCYEVFDYELETSLYLLQEYESEGKSMPQFINTLRAMKLPIHPDYKYSDHIDPISGFKLNEDIGRHIESLWLQAKTLHGENNIYKIVLNNL